MPAVLWIDNEPLSFDKPLRRLLRQDDICLENRLSVGEAIDYLEECGDDLPKCIILDAILPLGGFAGSLEALEHPDTGGTVSESMRRLAQSCTGRLVLDRFPVVGSRTIVFSVAPGEKLKEVGFPADIPKFFLKKEFTRRKLEMKEAIMELAKK